MLVCGFGIVLQLCCSASDSTTSRMFRWTLNAVASGVGRSTFVGKNCAVVDRAAPIRCFLWGVDIQGIWVEIYLQMSAFLWWVPKLLRSHLYTYCHSRFKSGNQTKICHDHTRASYKSNPGVIHRLLSCSPFQIFMGGGQNFVPRKTIRFKILRNVLETIFDPCGHVPSC